MGHHWHMSAQGASCQPAATFLCLWHLSISVRVPSSFSLLCHASNTYLTILSCIKTLLSRLSTFAMCQSDRLVWHLNLTCYLPRAAHQLCSFALSQVLDLLRTGIMFSLNINVILTCRFQNCNLWRNVWSWWEIPLFSKLSVWLIHLLVKYCNFSLELKVKAGHIPTDSKIRHPPLYFAEEFRECLALSFHQGPLLQSITTRKTASETGIYSRKKLLL